MDPKPSTLDLPEIAFTKRLLPDRRGRRKNEVVDTAIVHSMGEHIRDTNGDRGPPGQIYDAWDWLDRLDISAYALFPPEGGVIECADVVADLAWHAKGWNKRSIGAEFLVHGTHDWMSHRFAIGINPATGEPLPTPRASPFTEEQYQVGGWWYARASLLVPSFGRHVIAHSVASPKRKVDPGPLFDWPRFWYWFDRFVKDETFRRDVIVEEVLQEGAP